ncbi:hypothetical protein [Tahibacter amnicola]|uniref:Secreted protein n=1 Tax=Tahibacter amnicola TaxID=2976241 RepID=A0ABY6BLT1_9GAMM|nr:hypothetical protein [Tahibacter amnicola]UXI70408.1 hypothetical protein N4264_12460 [Tahibacter amnicola]
MKASAIATVLVASSLFVVGSTIDRESRGKPPSTVVPAASVPAASVPARHVAPERISHVVTLPQVTVRPSAEDLELARGETSTDDTVASVSRLGTAGPLRTAPTVGRVNFDMPYYSFGKVMPHVSRE